ncbi:7745_t:CDS:1 [Dentiscutata erythropus]|uniref:7745_t:CDS:1 n=1 Tax=Dentiscutata erythropus TaxID=1348616 RepID=A0A9N9N1T3_9GLOM|nr:7745_t:CDS:1 [Dentiscutata erythropus]
MRFLKSFFKLKLFTLFYFFSCIFAFNDTQTQPTVPNSSLQTITPTNSHITEINLMSLPTSTSYEPATITTPKVKQTDVVHDIESSQLTQIRVITKYHHASSMLASPTSNHNLPARETVTPGVSSSSGLVRIWWRNFPEYEGYRKTILASWIVINFFAYLFLFGN